MRTKTSRPKNVLQNGAWAARDGMTAEVFLAPLGATISAGKSGSNSLANFVARKDVSSAEKLLRIQEANLVQQLVDQHTETLKHEQQVAMLVGRQERHEHLDV